MEHNGDAVKASGGSSQGIWYGITAYTAWGILPLYWKLLDTVPAHEILAHRIFWSFIFTGLILLVSGGRQTLAAALADKRRLFFTFSCGFIISLNWFTYIYAVNSNHVIEASMGYYINPLVVVLLGVTVLKEKLSSWQGAAIALAAIGVLIITVQYGKVPWIALFLAVSFALYGLTKKLVGVDPVTGLALETFIVMPFALLYLVSLAAKGTGAIGTVSPATALILAGSGIVTSLPLLLFARGVQKSKLSMMGFLQYIAPTISLLLGVYVFKEYFSLSHLISFCFIWLALTIFTLANLGVLKEPIRDRSGAARNA
jgi:chloramphenicol-sensitive protein RarD